MWPRRPPAPKPLLEPVAVDVLARDWICRRPYARQPVRRTPAGPCIHGRRARRRGRQPVGAKDLAAPAHLHSCPYSPNAPSDILAIAKPPRAGTAVPLCRFPGRRDCRAQGAKKLQHRRARNGQDGEPCRVHKSFRESIRFGRKKARGAQALPWDAPCKVRRPCLQHRLRISHGLDFRRRRSQAPAWARRPLVTCWTGRGCRRPETLRALTARPLRSQPDRNPVPAAPAGTAAAAPGRRPMRRDRGPGAHTGRESAPPARRGAPLV